MTDVLLSGDCVLRNANFVCCQTYHNVVGVLFAGKINGTEYTIKNDICCLTKHEG